MAKQHINTGLAANDKSGDPLRTAFDKVNNNFDELYTLVGGSISGLTELAQDYAAPLLAHAGHTGITFTYDDNANKLIATVSTVSQVNADWNAISGPAIILNKPLVPTNTKQLNNDAGFITSTSSLVNGARSLTLDSFGVVNVPLSQFNTAQVFAPYNETLMLGNSSHYVQVRGTDGALIFPDYSVQTTAYTGAGDGVKYASTLDAYSGDFTVSTQQLVLVFNNSVTSRTITLPATPTAGQTVTIKKIAAFSSYTVVIDGNGKYIDTATTLSFNNSWGYVTLVYSSGTGTDHGPQWFIVGGNYATV